MLNDSTDSKDFGLMERPFVSWHSLKMVAYRRYGTPIHNHMDFS